MPSLNAVSKSAAAFALTWALHASAQPVLMLDFGPTAVSGTSTVGGNSVNNTVNSPYHTVNSGFTDSIWNQVNTSDVNSGLKYSDNSDATGVTVNLGAATATTTIDLAGAVTSSPLTSNGSATTTGVYGAGSVGKDATFTTGTNTRVGVQIGGLAAGSYDIYVIARNTNLGSASTASNQQTVYVGAGSAGNFDYSSLSSASLTYGTNASVFTSAWIQGENYVKLSVTLSALDVLNVAVAGTPLSGGSETRGFLNAVQVVAVPEPASFAALAGLAGLALVGTRRRRPALASATAA